MNIPFNFSGVTAVVTGGASGIGRAVVRAMLESGAEVAVLDINQQGLSDLAQEAAESGKTLHTVHCNVADRTEAEEAVLYVEKTCRTPHMLVNSIGLNIRKPLSVLSDDELDNMYQVNVFGVLRICRLFACLMEQDYQHNGGSRRKIVNIASTGAWQGSKHYGGYNSSKAALVNATRIMANEWYSRGIQVNALCPGPTMTPFLEPFYLENPNMKEEVIRKTPAGRIAKPEDHVGPVLFLLSSASDWIVGETLVSDGGKGLNS